MGERLLCTQEVSGSNPLISTRFEFRPKYSEVILSILFRPQSRFCTLRTEQRKTKKSKATEGAMLERVWQQQKMWNFKGNTTISEIFCEMPA